MRKSNTVSVALLAAVAATGVSGRSACPESAPVLSVALETNERGGFGQTVEPYWPLALVAAGFLLLSPFGGGE